MASAAINVEVKIWRYLRVVIGIAVIFVLSILLRSFTGGALAKEGIYNADWFILVMICHFAASWRKVPTGYNAGLAVFEQEAWEMGSGWYYVPFLICRIGFFPIAEQQDQFPSDPENISKLPDTSRLGRNEVRPMRIMTGPGEAGSDDVLSERTSPEVTFSVRWYARKKSFFELMNNLPGTSWSDKHRAVRQTMRDTGEGLLTRMFSVRSPARIVSELGVIDGELKQAIQTAFARFDIEIVEVLLQSPDFGTGVNHALAEVIQARARAKITGTDALAERNRQITVAEGDKAARILQADARKIELAAEGEGRRDAAKALDMDGAAYMALDKAPGILGDKTIIIGADGAAQALAMGATVIKQFTTKKGT